MMIIIMRIMFPLLWIMRICCTYIHSFLGCVFSDGMMTDPHYDVYFYLLDNGYDRYNNVC